MNRPIQRRFPLFSPAFFLIAMCAFLAQARQADAAVCTWTGTNSGLWSDPANWGGALPAAGDDLVFPEAALHRDMTNDVAAGTVFRSLTFGDVYTIQSGNPLTLGEGGIQVSPQSAAFETDILVDITLSTSQTWGNSVYTPFVLVVHNVHLNGQSLTVDWPAQISINGSIDGTGAIIKNGIGTLSLPGNNSYAGPTTINQGSIEVLHANALGISDGTAANGTFINGNGFIVGALRVNAVAVGNEAVVVDSSLNGAAALQGMGVSSLGGPITLVHDAKIRPWPGATFTLAGAIDGPGGLIVDGTGTLVLAHDNNTFAGGLTVQALGDVHTLRVDADNGIPSNTSLTLDNLATLVINNHAQTLNTLMGAGHLDLPTAGSTLSVTGNASTLFSGTLTGTGVLQNAGSGHLSVAGTSNAFTGTFRASSGSLSFAGSSPGTGSAAPGGRFEFTNKSTIGRLLGSGGTISIRGNATASNNGGTAVQLSSASTFEVQSGDINTLQTLTVVGSVALGNSTLSLRVTPPFAPPIGTTYTLIDNDGTDPVNGTFAGLAEGSTFSVEHTMLRISYAAGPGNNDVVLTVVPFEREYLLSEGATSNFFTTDILLANPNDQPAPLHIAFLKDDGTTVALDETLAPKSHKMIRVNDVDGMAGAQFSTVVRSLDGVPIAVERTMSWDRSGYGAHTEHATDGAALTWYFAEGSQGYFHTYLLLANPQTTANVATVEYLREGDTPVTRTYQLDPSSRRTIDLGDDAALENRSFGITVTFQQPGAAERAMYFGMSPLFNGGHESAGVNAPSTTWFLAEGATGPFFETFVLLSNPNATEANVTLTYLPSFGPPIAKQKTVPANGRLTINIETEDPALANAAVSTQVVSTLPIVVERSQYWPDPAPNWYEAHNSAGVTTLGPKWALAEGRVGTVDGIAGAQTYILLANPGTTAAQVTITFLRGAGATPVTKSFIVQPTSRFNVRVETDVPELTNEHFGALITADQPIAVERALYWDANGQVWAAGTNATAMHLPSSP